MKIQALAAALLLLPALSFAQSPAGATGHHRGMHGGLERLDTDNDGRISRAEFDAGQKQRDAWRAQHPERAARIEQRKHEAPTFAALDANRDGYIVRSETTAYRERMRPQRDAERRARFDARFKEADLNRDGKLGRVEVQEKMPRMADRFAWLDDNRDGFLSRAELEAGHQRR